MPVVGRLHRVYETTPIGLAAQKTLADAPGIGRHGHLNRKEQAFVEAAYRLQAPHLEWFGEIIRIWAQAFSPSPEAHSGTTYSLGEIAEGGLEGADIRARSIHHQLDETMFLKAARQLPPSAIQALCGRSTCSTLSARIAQDPRLTPALLALWKEAFGEFGFQDVIGLVSVEQDGLGSVFCAYYEGPVRLQPRIADRWQRLNAHVSHALRLRSSLGTASVLDSAAAVLSPTGRSLYARSAARSSSAQQLFKHRVHTMEQAQTRSRRVREPDELLRVWQGLVEGRWTVVERCDTDGRRYYVVLENPSPAVPLHRLSNVEQDVLSCVIRGMADKAVASHLGLQEHIVIDALASVRRKTRIRSRIELIHLGSHLLNGPPTPAE